MLAALRRQGVNAHPFDPAEMPLDALRVPSIAPSLRCTVATVRTARSGCPLN